MLWFHEFFHGDTGEGLGASHQTGWTALLAHLLLTTPAATSMSPLPGRGQAETPEDRPASHSSGGGTP